MKQKREIIISLILALMMVASTFVVGAGNIINTTTPLGPQPGLNVEKLVWDYEDWADQTEANIGDVVKFCVNITYYPFDTEPPEVDGDEAGYKATNIVVKDMLPPCLDFKSTIEIKHGTNTYYGQSYVSPDLKTVFWNLTSDHSIELWDTDPAKPRTVLIVFNATVVGYGENTNCVEVDALEKCSNEPLEGCDCATVIVEEELTPDIDIEKYVWDEDLDDWTSGPITAYEGDSVTFLINVTNTGTAVLHNVYIQDVLPPFLLYGGPLSANIGSLNPGESYEGQFTCTVDNVDEVLTDDNYVNVTCDEGVEDEDTVTITVKPHFILEKEVWNGTAWTEFKDTVRIGETVKFRITATYYGDDDDLMKCLIIGDILPEVCLEYADNEKIWIAGQQITSSSSMWPDIYVGEGEVIEVCGHELELPEGVIVWDWRNVVFGLEDSQSVVIEFETVVTEYCDECQQERPPCPCGDDDDDDFQMPPCINPNCAFGAIWGCMQCTPCQYHYDMDCAFVRCCPPTTKFTKKVLVDDEWVDQIETYKDSTVNFQLKLEYYGNEELTDIQFVDHLPCILEYADNAIVTYIVDGNVLVSIGQEAELSDDGKTLYWNLTENLTDGGIITITFNAYVTGVTTGNCPDCQPQCECINEAWVYGKTGCPPGPFEMYDYVDIISYANCPPSIPQLSGDTSGEEDEVLSYTVWTTDPDDDKVYYMFDWDDDTIMTWIGPYDEGQTNKITKTHSWDTAGTYKVKVRVKDEHGLTSDWTDPLTVVISETGEEGLQVSINKGFSIGTAVGANVKNLGEDPINDVTWNITVKKMLLGTTLADTGDVIETLDGGDTEAVTTGAMGLKLAIGKVTAKAEGGGYSDEATATAIILGFFVYVL